MQAPGPHGARHAGTVRAAPLSHSRAAPRAAPAWPALTASRRAACRGLVPKLWPAILPDACLPPSMAGHVLARIVDPGAKARHPDRVNSLFLSRPRPMLLAGSG